MNNLPALAKMAKIKSKTGGDLCDLRWRSGTTRASCKVHHDAIATYVQIVRHSRQSSEG